MALGPSMHCGCCGQALVTAMWCSLRRRGVRDSSSALDATPPLEQTRSAAAVSTLAPTERTNAVAKTTSHSVTHPMWPGVGCSGVGCCASQRKLATDGNRGSYLLEHGARPACTMRCSPRQQVGSSHGSATSSRSDKMPRQCRTLLSWPALPRPRKGDGVRLTCVATPYSACTTDADVLQHPLARTPRCCPSNTGTVGASENVHGVGAVQFSSCR